MKVLHVIDHTGLGGAQRVALDLARSTRELGITADLIALRSDSLEFIPHQCLLESPRSCSAYSIKPLWRLKRLSRGYDLVHCHLFKSMCCGAIVKALYQRGMKLVMHEHGDIFDAGLLKRATYRILAEYIDQYIAVSVATKTVLQQETHLEESRLSVIPNPFVPFGRHRQPTHERNSSEFIIGFLGRLEDQKGLPYLLSAFDRLDDSTKLRIAGVGSKEITYRTMTKALHRRTSVEFVGFQDASDFLSGCDVLVIPSTFEPFGRVMLEAFHLGIPVIASDLDGPREIVGGSGCAKLVPTGNVAALASAIQEVKDNPVETQKMTAIAKEVVSRYGIENATRALIEIYRKLVR